MGMGFVPPTTDPGAIFNPEPPEEPPDQEKRRLKAWKREVEAAKRDREDWEEEFDCEKNEEYYKGHQWGDDEKYKDYYVINLCFPTLEAKLPSVLYNRPKVIITPKPSRADDPFTLIDERARTREDTLNSIIADPETQFMTATTLATHESHYRFGLVRVGFSADVVDNPNAGKPLLSEFTGEPLYDEKGEPVVGPPQIPTREGVWFKRIPAKDFLSSAAKPHNKLHLNEWVGYGEWVRVEDVKANPYYANTHDLKLSGRLSKHYGPPEEVETSEEKDKRRGLIYIYHIWSNREKKYYVFADNGKRFLVDGEPFEKLPLALLGFHPIMDSVRPVPPMTPWRPIQDELNETRQMQRIHRRRFVRRYLTKKGLLDQEAQDKLRFGPDGSLVEVGDLESIKPLEDAKLDSAVAMNVPSTKEDFMEVTASSNNQRSAQSQGMDTATEAAIVEGRFRLREHTARTKVSEWLAEICAIALHLIETKASLPFWIERNVDPQGPGLMQEFGRVATAWEMITYEMGGSLSYDVSIDIDSLSPVSQDIQRTEWTQVLALLTQPTIMPLLVASDGLLRRTLSLYNIRGDKQVQEIRMALIMTMLAQAQMTAASGGEGAPGGRKPDSKPAPGPGPLPAPDARGKQLEGQMGLSGPSQDFNV